VYVRTRAELDSCLAERWKNQQSIRRRRDDFVRRYCGLDDFSALVDHHWRSVLAERRAVGILCRQIASIAVEDVACYLGCLALGLSPWAGELVQDGFYTVNPDKLYRVKIPWLRWAKKGNPVMQYERLSDASNVRLEGMILAQVKTREGIALPDWHHQHRARVFGNRYPFLDMSAFFSDCLRRATRRPAFMYAESDSGYEQRVHCNGDPLTRDFRPPAEWYYPIYLSLFVDGSLVLLENYDDSYGGSLGVKRLFEDAMSRIEAVVGVRPLVLQTSALSPETWHLLYYNQHLLHHSPDAESAIRVLSHERNISALFERAAAVAYRMGAVVPTGVSVECVPN